MRSTKAFRGAEQRELRFDRGKRDKAGMIVSVETRRQESKIYMIRVAAVLIKIRIVQSSI